MKLEITKDQKSIHPGVDDFLASDELVNNTSIGVLESLRLGDRYENYEVLQVLEEGKLIGYGHHTPPHAIYFAKTEHKQAHELLAKHLDARRGEFYGVAGEARTVDSICKHLQHSLDISEREEQGLYQLKKVIPAKPIPGKMVVAEHEHLSFLVPWTHAFEHECELEESSDEDLRRLLSRKIDRGDIHLWKDGDKFLGCASFARTLSKGKSISLVFTPPEFRGNGVAGNVVAQLSQKALDSGVEYLCLFTQMKNPISNRVYLNIGYEYKHSFVHLKLNDV